MKRMQHYLIALLVAGAVIHETAIAQTPELIRVVAKGVSRTIDLPGELEPFLNVTLHARVTGYVEKVLVDRASVVKQGQILVELSAPEMKAQITEAESKVLIAESERLQAEAKLASMEATLASLQATLASAQATYDHLKTASQTPGVVAGNDLEVALRTVEAQRSGADAQRASIQAQRASIEGLRNGKAAAEASLRTLKEMEAYLRVTAPFDGVVTARFTHPGALVGPNTGSPLLEIQQVAKLRLVVSVPEENVGAIVHGATVSFSVPAYPGRMFSGAIARVPPALDSKTRSKPVELDVVNRDQLLAPGMYPTVLWPVRSSEQALFVPKTSVVTTTERTFVVREENGRAEWVNVQKGAPDGDMIRVIGSLQPGDLVVKRATDEIREGVMLKSPSR